MFDKLKSVEKRYNDLNQFLSDPKIISQQTEFQKYAREQSELNPIVLRFQDWQKITRQLEENRKILVSHTVTFSEELEAERKRVAAKTKKVIQKLEDDKQHSTLGDLESLADLKKNLESNK